MFRDLLLTKSLVVINELKLTMEITFPGERKYWEHNSDNWTLIFLFYQSKHISVIEMQISQNLWQHFSSRLMKFN